ncbi:6-aminohexanoate hydrolase [Moraxella ovis]|uniref:6-aminohexanoate hydrolase n=2 Tax=Moraxella ovis TaxID=29433 RepID=A0A378PRT9_9GAMM|nr:serine hydrolase [Moraxella ovis]ANB91924.1 6-aminohexanoate hydrolase [Moraxella ovis]STY87659.1 6-aminohexanoate-dimer hydrolase [Moraxella ovis]
MKKLTLAILTASLTMTAHAQSDKQYPTAAETTPDKLGFMAGSPPPKDKVLSFFDGSATQFPATRYTYSHVREFMPTKTMPVINKDRHSFDYAIDSQIDNVRFVPMGEKQPITWRESLDKNYVDGVVVLHKGKIVYENYLGELKPNGQHIIMSITKSFTGTLAATLVHEGVIDDKQLVKHYVPELADSAWGDATVRQVMDMTASLDYSEEYADPKADIWEYNMAGSPYPKPEGYQGAKTFYEYLTGVKKQGRHDSAFEYKTVNTDVLGWVIARATGRDLAELMSEKIWQPLGANYEGYFLVDSVGTPFLGGGLNINLQDMARFGEMMRRDGHFNGKQIVPKAVIDDIKRGGNRALFSKGGYPNLKGWSYRNMWWVTHNANNAFMARGVYGQAIYIDPKAQMVIARMSSNPVASNAHNDKYSLPAYQAMADYLMKK